jgi:exodeoxyribonuclease-1
MSASMLWYDLETFGLDPAHDRIAQFAGVRTDENLEEIDEPLVLYCQPAVDYLPSPTACLVHGITPQTAMESGIKEYDFALRILKEMAVPATTTSGFNSINFDDEFIRFLFYKNLLEVYTREWENGNSRWDIINLVRAAHDIRPEGIVWPRDADGRPIFKLEAIAKANGVVLAAAHDALHDIRATIGVAKLIKIKQPKLYAWYYSHRKRENLKPLIDLPSRKMLVHTSSEYTRPEGCTTLIAPVAMDAANRNQLVAIDLRFAPEPLVDLSVEEIRARVFTKKEALTGERIPLSQIKLNRCPFLAPVSTLHGADAERLGLDIETSKNRLDFIAATPGLALKLKEVFDEPIPPLETDDPDYRLYSDGFFPDKDRERLARVHEIIGTKGPQEAKNAVSRMKFQDARIPKLAKRFFARNFPETLSGQERLKWRDYCASRIQLPARAGSAELADYARFAETRLVDPTTSLRDKAILHALLDWKSGLEAELLKFEDK